MTERPAKSHGRKAIRPSLKPASLMDEEPDLVGVPLSVLPIIQKCLQRDQERADG